MSSDPLLGPSGPVGKILRAKCRTCKHPILNHQPSKPNKLGEPTPLESPAHCTECKCIVRWSYVVKMVRSAR